MADTAIEWTQKTWNPTTGCDKVSDGCDNCYALLLAARLKAMGSAKYQNDGNPVSSGPGFALTLHPSTLPMPRTWKAPQRVFVNSMSDLFHGKVPLDYIRDVFAVIADTPRHSYQILTKRALRLRRLADKLDWPSNLWMGVSIEHAGELRRVDDLRQVPTALRFLSCEPLLGPLDGLDLTGIHWVIVGGESGRKARPMHPDWARSLRDQCQDAGVPFFFKQHGEWRPPRAGEEYSTLAGLRGKPPAFLVDHAGAVHCTWEAAGPDARSVLRVGKHAAGRELDGRTWDEYPEVRHHG